METLIVRRHQTISAPAWDAEGDSRRHRAIPSISICW
jgi:hypothetical protein